MNLKSLHTYLGQLLDAGVAPDIPVVALADEWPREVHDIYMFDGGYHADMAPKLVVGRLIGPMLTLVPIGEDTGALLSGSAEEQPTHRRIALPIEPPYKA
ncbi:hypothetical protein [Duganella sp. LjRoot269]|uniref:hypothetical protein n=1 Tax=Duganella sp. LjRoot269 TaxID=3342305 RepID=UPI003ED074D7